MAPVLAQVILPHKSGLPRNNVVNDFAFTTTNPEFQSGDMGAITTALGAFYKTLYGGFSVGSMFSESILRTPLATVKYYDLTGHLNGTPHGSPSAVSNVDIGASETGIELPAEVAICMSFRTSYAGDAEFAPGTRPRARDRGRIYLGPLTTACLSYDATAGRAFMHSGRAQSIALAGAALRDAPNFAWCVWSRKNQSINPVTDIWVDDAFDIQRRRGEAPVSRSVA